MFDQSSELVSRTLKILETINFEDFTDDWVKEVFLNDFMLFDGYDLSPDLLFTEDGIETVRKLTKVLNVWASKHFDGESINGQDDSCASDIQDQSLQHNEVLWTVLKSHNIDLKYILSLIYLLCSRSILASSSYTDKILGLTSSQLYLSLLNVPGSVAYSAYYQNLVRLCLNCLKFPKEKTQGRKKAPVSAFRNEVTNQRRRVCREEKDMPNGDDECMDVDDNCAADNIEVEFSAREWDKIMFEYALVLKALIALLKKVSLAKDVEIIEHIIQKLVDCAACEDSSLNLKFDINPSDIDRRIDGRNYTYILSSMAYSALLVFLESDKHGNKQENYLLILRNLMEHILCCKVKTPQIPHRYQIIKDNAVAFVCYNLKVNGEVSVFPSKVLLQQLCLRVNDKSDFRAKVSQSVITILYSFPVRNIAELVKWLHDLIQTNKVQSRVIALEIFALMITREEKLSFDQVSSDLVVYTTLLPVANSILMRCNDKAPSVRTKAINLLSQNIKEILQILENNKEDLVDNENNNSSDEDDDEAERSIYLGKEKTQKEKIDLIVQMLHRRSGDPIVTARKAALFAMESLIEFDQQYLSVENLKLFPKASTDPNVAVRKQTIQSVASLLESFGDHAEIHDCWLRTVLPLVFDPEKTVQTKCLEVMETQFLINIFSGRNEKMECAWKLLLKLVSGELILLQRYLRKAFSIWKGEQKLRPQMAPQLEKCFNPEREAGIWLFLSMFTANFEIRNTNFFVLDAEKYIIQDVPPSFMGNVLQTLGYICKRVPPEKLKELQGLLEDKLMKFDFPVELIADATETYYKIQMILKQNNIESSALFTEVMQKCVDFLSHYALEEHSNTVCSDDQIERHLFMLGEMAQLYPKKLPQKAILIIKSIIASPSLDSSVAPSSALGKVVSPTIRAYAFVTLGKVCLQNESLTKEIIPALAKELVVSKHAIIRNNVIVVMIDMCTRYTSFVDLYIPLISACLKDEQFLVRRQTLTFLIKLLQEDYIKWKGTLFHRTLTTVIDAEPTIRALAEYSLGYLLFQRKPNIFSDNFIDCIFLFNNYIPPNNKKLNQDAKEMELFSLKGSDMKDKRMVLYKFMLKHTQPGFRVQLYLQIGQEILNAIAENILPLNEDSEGVIKDSLAIISCQEMKSFDNPTASTPEETEETDEYETNANAEVLQEKHRLLFIEPIVPAIISLKNLLVSNKSPLVNDVMLFLRDFLKDYKSELKTILASDKQLAKEIEFDMRMFEAQEQKRLQEAKEKELAAKARKSVVRNIIDEDHLLQSAEKARSVGRLRASIARPAEEDKTPLRLPRSAHTMANMQPVVLCRRLDLEDIPKDSLPTQPVNQTSPNGQISPETASPSSSGEAPKKDANVYLGISTPFHPTTKLHFSMQEEISEIEASTQNSVQEDMDTS